MFSVPLEPLATDAPAIVYVDFKSPYAYLAIEPTRELERELGLQFDWRPFVLDIPSYLGSARLGADGSVVEQQRSAEQWSGVKYAYYDCRRYAGLAGLTIRGTEKIWDTHLVATAMLWVKQFGPALQQQFIDSIYPPFWVRSLDLESEEVIGDLLARLGLDSAAFSAWANDAGFATNRELQSSAFRAGIYGVPSYVIGDQCYFGREHLPSVRWEILGRPGARPDVANPLPAASTELHRQPARVSIGVDDSLDSLLALPHVLNLLRDYPGPVQWLRARPRPFATMPPADDLSRGAMHARFRIANAARDAERYGPPGMSPDVYPAQITALLNAAGLSLGDEGPEQVLRPAMPGIVVLLDDEIFIGRQHLPLIARHFEQVIER
jgi:2-hydroxychromene-2-carboxylate isomerase